MNVMQQSYGNFLGTNHKSLLKQTGGCSNCGHRIQPEVQQNYCIEEEESEDDLVSAIDRRTRDEKLVYGDYAFPNQEQQEPGDDLMRNLLAYSFDCF